MEIKTTNEIVSKQLQSKRYKDLDKKWISVESLIKRLEDDSILSYEDLKDNMWKNPNEVPGNGLDDDKNGYIDDIHGIHARLGLELLPGELQFSFSGCKLFGVHYDSPAVCKMNPGNSGTVAGVAWILWLFVARVWPWPGIQVSDDPWF
jgi:hypothetical protein